MKNKYLIITIFFIIGIAVGYTVNNINSQDNDDDFHIHADFIVSINGEQLNFSKDEFQSIPTRQFHKNVHLHDNNGDVIHYHKENITLQEFFTSIGMNITQDCFSTKQQEFCSNQTHQLQTYVNGNLIDSAYNYVAEDEDKIAIIYDEVNTDVQPILTSITNDSCIYSRTCPERGEPPESTCITGEACMNDLPDHWN